MTALTEPIDAPPSARPPTDPREHLTSSRTRAVLRIQNGLLTATRAHLAGRGFTELLPPVIGPVTDPGARGSKQVDVDFYGHRYKLMSSAILYKQASLLAFDRFFYVAPNVRLEPPAASSTNRHLVEFHQIDVEVAGADRKEILRIIEDLVKHVIRRVLDAFPAELALLGRDTTALAAALHGSFGHTTHQQAHQRLHALGHDQSPDTEIDWEAEARLSRDHEQPFFVTGYPKGSRGFYDKEDPQQPGALRSFDLLAPEGYGELCSGSERENNYDTVVSRMRETGENPAKYAWYLALMRQGLPASTGFGLGLERFTRYLAGLDAVWQASAFPKLPGVVSP